jgi:hypothetical protein
MHRTVLSSAWFAAQKSLLWVGTIPLVALAAACGASNQQSLNPVSPSVVTAASDAAASAVAPASQHSNTVPREVSGKLDGRFTFVVWGPGWWDFYTDGNVTGTLSHLGLARMYTRHTPHADGTLTDGTFEIVAANGDEIRGTYGGSASYDAVRPDLVHGAATFVISGGTGRFLGATGTLTATFLETLDDPSWASAKVAWTLEGTVNY